MTDAAPILSVDIDDTKFQDFLDKFEKHKEALGRMPGVWAGIGKAAGETGSGMDHLLAASLGIGASLDKIAASQDKFLKTTQQSGLALERNSSHALMLSRSLADGAMSMLKISSIAGVVSGLLGAGGLWGIDRLAASAAGARRSAMGLGVSSGQEKAFGINYGRVLDNPSGLLETIANAQGDPRQAWPFAALGIQDYASKNAAELAPELLDRIRSKAKTIDPRALTALAGSYGWTNFESMDEIRRSVATPDDEWARLQKQNRADQEALSLPPGTQEAWQDLTAQLNRAGQTIENTFIIGLAPLAPQLADLSKSFTEAAAAFLKSPEVKEGLEDLSAGLKDVAKWLKDGKSSWNDKAAVPVTQAGEDAHPTKLGKWMYRNFDRLRGPADSGWDPSGSWVVKGLSAVWRGITGTLGAANPVSPAQAGEMKGGWRGVQSSLGDMTSGGALDRAGMLKFTHDFLRAHGHSEAETAGIMAAAGKESGWRIGAVSKDGGHGMFQWTGSREKEFERVMGIAADKATLQQQLNYFEYERTHEEKGAWARMAGGPDNPADKYSAFRKYIERPNEGDRLRDESSGRASAQQYASSTLHSPAPVSVQLHVTNQTGANVSTLGAMAATPG